MLGGSGSFQFAIFAGVAQSVERHFCKVLRSLGSNPTTGS